MKELIKKLTEAYGPSGNEEQVRQIIQAEIAGLADEVRTDALGNLIAVKKPAAGATPAVKVMLAAHMDEIGLIVTHIDDKGFLRFGTIGGINPLTQLGGRVRFASGRIGVIGIEKLEPNEYPKLEKMYIDIGAKDKAEAETLVSVGDAAGFWRDCVLQGNRVVAKAMDDRIACAVLVQTLKELTAPPNEVYFVFTVQEEVGLRGAITSAYGLEPDVAIAVDVTLTGDTPEARTMAVALGQGPAIKVKDSGMLAHPGVKQLLVEAAKALGIHYQLEVLVGGTTDAMAMQVSRSGVPAGVVSIPTRYVHSPSEMVDASDVQNAVKLLLKVLANPVVLPA